MLKVRSLMFVASHVTDYQSISSLPALRVETARTGASQHSCPLLPTCGLPWRLLAHCWMQDRLTYWQKWHTN